MKKNPTHRGTYAGQPATLYVAFENTRGRKLFALRTPSGVLATAWDTLRELRRFAAEKYLNMNVDSQ
jgi:hypothetical protein